jgi:cytochrome d ubiquinol oxidase subunit I
VIFWSFRVMVGLGLLMAAAGLVSLFLRWRRTLYDTRWFHRLSLLMGPSGFVAVIAGWITTEVGRQPYTVYGLLTTAESRSPIAAPAVGASLTAFVIVYFLLFGMGTLYILRLMRHPPAALQQPVAAVEPIRTAGLMPGPAMGADGTAKGAVP